LHPADVATRAALLSGLEAALLHHASSCVRAAAADSLAVLARHLLTQHAAGHAAQEDSQQLQAGCRCGRHLALLPAACCAQPLALPATVMPLCCIAACLCTQHLHLCAPPVVLAAGL
jgi:hypothetical protein